VEVFRDNTEGRCIFFGCNSAEKLVNLAALLLIAFSGILRKVKQHSSTEACYIVSKSYENVGWQASESSFGRNKYKHP